MITWTGRSDSLHTLKSAWCNADHCSIRHRLGRTGSNLRPKRTVMLIICYYLRSNCQWPGTVRNDFGMTSRWEHAQVMVVSCHRTPRLIPVRGLDPNGPLRRRARPTTSTLSVPLGRRGSQTSAARNKICRAAQTLHLKEACHNVKVGDGALDASHSSSSRAIATR